MLSDKGNAVKIDEELREKSEFVQKLLSINSSN
jgi:hypothetical protein